MPDTPLLKNENCAILHVSRACQPHKVSDGAAISGGNSFLIRGGSDPAKGGEGSAGYLPPMGVGGSPQNKNKSVGGYAGYPPFRGSPKIFF
jgi:hypothetical protein